MPTVSCLPARNASFSLVPTPSVPTPSTGSRNPSGASEAPPKPPTTVLISMGATDGTLGSPAQIRCHLAWLTRINSFRIGLLTGLAFAALHVLQIAGRADVPVLTRMEGALTDLRFLQRVSLFGSSHSGQVVIAAVDEAAIARFGRFPWDRRGGAPPRVQLHAVGGGGPRPPPHPS